MLKASLSIDSYVASWLPFEGYNILMVKEKTTVPLEAESSVTETLYKLGARSIKILPDIPALSAEIARTRPLQNKNCVVLPTCPKDFFTIKYNHLLETLPEIPFVRVYCETSSIFGLFNYHYDLSFYLHSKYKTVRQLTPPQTIDNSLIPLGSPGSPSTQAISRLGRVNSRDKVAGWLSQSPQSPGN